MATYETPSATNSHWSKQTSTEGYGTFSVGDSLTQYCKMFLLFFGHAVFFSGNGKTVKTVDVLNGQTGLS